MDEDTDKKISQYKDILSNNVLLNYACRKADRLAAGVFLVTESMAPAEPLRHSLRKGGIELINALFRIHGEAVYEKAPIFIIGELVALLSVGATAGLITEGNRRVLDEEYRKLASFVLERMHELRGTFSAFPETFFESPHGEVALGVEYYPGSRKGHTQQIKDSENVLDKTYKKRTKELKGQNGLTKRQDTILRVLDTKGTVTIKDIVQVVSDLSEKTIQRELSALVLRGVLKREGERRWSTYRRV
jgi:hypothetical protein